MAQTMRRRRVRPQRALAWMLVVATLAICLAATGRHSNGGALFHIPYEDVYAGMSPALRPLFVTFLILILMLLFCSISITASDFFCPNLATIADYLGLSETTAGVTLLAFGNGSPDVFSTFVSVREGTFGLAVGELIGAASFITSIVVGSIAMVQPFHVPRFAFVRDIAFFTIAVLLLMLVLEDGKLTLRESGAMVALYACYVGVVVLHNWYSSRKRRAAEYAELGWKVGDEEVEVETDPAPPVPPPATVVESLVQLQPSTPITPKVRFPRRLSSASVVRAAESDEETAADTQRAGFSLLGAVEFRDVVNSLRRDPMTSPTSSRGGSRPSSPLPSPLVEHHHHDFSHQLRHHRRSSSQGIQVIEDSLSRRSSGPGRQRSGSLHPASATRPPPRFRTVSDSERLAAVPASPEPGPENNSLPMSPLPRRAESQPEVDKATLRVVIPPLELRDGGLSASPSSFDASRPPSGVASPLPPHISVVDPEGDMGSPIVPLTRTNTEATIGQHVSGIVHRVLHVLFPSLQGFKHKSVLGMALAILSAPSIFFLTLTLPVVDDGRGDEGGVALPGGEDDAFDTASVDSRRSSVDHSEIGEALHHHLVDGHNLRPRHAHFESSTIVRSGSPCPSSEYDVQSNVSDCDVLDFNPALAAAQCVFGPVLCCYLVFQEDDHLPWILLGATILGSMAAVCVWLLASDGTAQPWRLVRCCCGFVCSMVWIASIADEVVDVLRTFGEIFGLSDAIIGLTIFAVGNSLADLVANITIAQFAPNMAYAACFGGPMLNLLLGVGGSGTYSIITSPSHSPVTLHFSPTLWVSGTGLLLVLATTAVAVPLNRFLIDRRWALVLLIAYAILMTVNVVVEVQSEGR